MDMIKYLLMVIISSTLHTSPALAHPKNQHVDLINNPYPQDIINNEIIEKRNSRKVYHHHENRLKLKPRPFSRYGPPRNPSASYIKRPSPQVSNEHLNSWSHQQHPRKHPNDVPEKIQGSKNTHDLLQHRPHLLEVPNPIRTFDFKDEDPIASQNSEPFKNNIANYLPPKNQKLPGYASHQSFQRHNFNNDAINMHMNPHGSSQISDATLFLLKNAKSLSKLYETPVINQNYPPFDDVPGSHMQFQEFGKIPDHSRKFFHPKIQSIPKSLSMNTFHAHQPIKTTKEFQQSLLQNSPGFPSKYKRLCGDPPKPAKLTSSNHWNQPQTDTSSPAIPATPATISSHVLDFQIQGNTPTTVFPYPGYNGVLPLFGTSFNLANHIPSYGVSAGSSSVYPTAVSGDSTPTHFTLPFPTIGGRGHLQHIQNIFGIVPTNILSN